MDALCSSQTITAKNIDEQSLSKQHPNVLACLLLDRTTNHNIIWATDDYSSYGPMHEAHAEITIKGITGSYSNIIAPRVTKSREKQAARTKHKAEVFTPSWICNVQNNLVDEAWFDRKDVFNHAHDKIWTSTTGKIEFSSQSSKSWIDYVDERRMEITCGEAPYLVSRYDTTTGSEIPLTNRIGLLDRKLRVVKENTDNEAHWLTWSKRAFESIYGFEYQGDSLLLARENLLATYVDYMRDALNREPTESELLSIATIISWNIWQMDGLTGYPPYCTVQTTTPQPTLFDFMQNNTNTKAPEPCKIKDWRAKEICVFNDLVEEGKRREANQ